MTVCAHGMPDPAACIECMAEGNIEPQRVEPERAVPGSWMLARHDGQCPECDLPIHAGREHITRTTRDRWVHARCAP